MSRLLPLRPYPIDHTVMQPEYRVERRQPASDMATLARFGRAGDDVTGVVRLALQRGVELVNRWQAFDRVDVGQCKGAASGRIVHQPMSLVQSPAPDGVDPAPRLADILSRIVPVFDIELRPVEERRRNPPRVLGPIPVRQREVGISTEFGAYLFKEPDVIPVPVQEFHLAMVTIVR